jgi:hypothetical protein
MFVWGYRSCSICVMCVAHRGMIVDMLNSFDISCFPTRVICFFKLLLYNFSAWFQQVETMMGGEHQHQGALASGQGDGEVIVWGICRYVQMKYKKVLNNYRKKQWKRRERASFPRETSPVWHVSTWNPTMHLLVFRKERNDEALLNQIENA